ncbi:MAG: hypothetical protein FWE59_06850 [Oscillospiraceae bacterium]|nr:hypothetical protein [Oscillospiraceae bacterium]
MAEFCLDCWNKLNHIRLKAEDVVLSDYLDFCEACAEMKPTIVCYRKHKKRPQARRREGRKKHRQPPG